MQLFFDTQIKDFILKSVYASALALADELETQLYGDLLKLFFTERGFLSYIEDFELTADNYGYFRETIKKHFTKEIFDELEGLFM